MQQKKLHRKFWITLKAEIMKNYTTEVHGGDTENHGVLLCETLCFLCATSCNSNRIRISQ